MKAGIDIRLQRHAARWLIPLALVASVFLGAGPASALSEIKREELPAPTSPEETGREQPNPGLTVPLPDAARNTPAGQDEPEDGDTDSLARPDISSDGTPPEIIRNLDRLPESVRRMHDLIIDAARSGDIERLRPLLGFGEAMTQISFGGVGDDPIAFLKELSGDPDGQELLAILEEVLSAGFVHLDAGTADELYVWPYFFAVPLDALDPRQRVELFKIVTAGDYEDMKAFGSYIFYRVGITPEGRWAFFVAGD